MNTKVIPCDHENALRQAQEALQNGGLIAFPTDTVYGVAAGAFDSAGIAQLYRAKERSASKAIAVLIGEPNQLAQVTLDLPPGARRLADAFWPGALTLVVPRHPALPANISPTETIGVRMPDHAFARELLRAAGPLAVTSANLSGGENPTSADEVLAQLAGRVALVLDGGRTGGGVPSTVVDCTGGQPVILRQGAIPAEQILQTWRGIQSKASPD